MLRSFATESYELSQEKMRPFQQFTPEKEAEINVNNLCVNENVFFVEICFPFNKSLKLV